MIVRLREIGVGVNLNCAISSGERVCADVAVYNTAKFPILLAIYSDDVARAERALL